MFLVLFGWDCGSIKGYVEFKIWLLLVDLKYLCLYYYLVLVLVDNGFGSCGLEFGS